MKIETQSTDETVLREMGQRLTRRRLDRGLTQAELAAQSGVSKRTVERIEAGASAQLVSVIRVLRTLGLADRLEALVPESTPSPMELLRLRGRQRQRAPGRRAKRSGAGTGTADEGEAGRDWTWGDDE